MPARSRHIGSDYHEIAEAGESGRAAAEDLFYHLDEPVEAASVFGSLLTSPNP
jgi:hypothetical protein